MIKKEWIWMNQLNQNKMMNDNKLIAEFMGAVGTPKYNPTEWDVYITGYLDVDSDDENAQHFYTPDEMKYRISWDWLMPVIEKCLDVSNDDNIEDFYSIQNVVPNIEATYQAVVEFIKEYNNGKRI